MSKDRIVELLRQAENSKCKHDCEFCELKKCEAVEFDEAINIAVKLVETSNGDQIVMI